MAQQQPVLEMCEKRESVFAWHTDAGLEQGIAHLREHGSACFGDVIPLPSSNCAHGHRLFWEWAIAQAPPNSKLAADRVETWTNTNGFPGSFGTGLQKLNGMGTSPLMELARTYSVLFWARLHGAVAHPECLPSSPGYTDLPTVSYVQLPPGINSGDISSRIESRVPLCVNMLTSFDGAGTFRPASIPFAPAKHWLHVDMDARRLPEGVRDLEYLQGVLLWTEARGQASGSFAYIPGSHRHLWNDADTYLAKPPKLKLGTHYQLIPHDHAVLRAAKLVLPLDPAGSIRIFYSATVHRNVPPKRMAAKAQKKTTTTKKRLRDGTIHNHNNNNNDNQEMQTPPLPELARLVSYVAMHPCPDPNTILQGPGAHTFTGRQLMQARAAFHATGACSSHWSTLMPRDDKPSFHQLARLKHHVTPPFCLNRPRTDVMDALICGTRLPASIQDRDFPEIKGVSTSFSRC